MTLETVQRYVDIASFNYQMDRKRFLFIIDPVLEKPEGEKFDNTLKFVESDDSLVIVGFRVDDQVIGLFANPETDKIIIFVADNEEVIQKFGVFTSTDIFNVIDQLRETYMFEKINKDRE